MSVKISKEAKTLLKLNESIDNLDNKILALYQEIGRLSQERFVLTSALKEQASLIKETVYYGK